MLWGEWTGYGCGGIKGIWMGWGWRDKDVGRMKGICMLR